MVIWLGGLMVIWLDVWIVGWLGLAYLAFRISKTTKFTLAKSRTPKKARSFPERRDFEYSAGKMGRTEFFRSQLSDLERLLIYQSCDQAFSVSGIHISN